MPIQIIDGNIWNTKSQVLVNTVNCVGVMGAGIALETKLRYPDMFKRYKEHCDSKSLDIGKLYLYTQSEPYWILNFPTKKHWKYPSKESYIIDGLNKFRDSYQDKKIKSIAFPVLGGLNGGLDENRVITIMQDHLHDLPINIEIYRYDKNSVDDFFIQFKNTILKTDLKFLSKQTGIKQRYLEKIYSELELNYDIKQINQLVKIQGIGEQTLIKVFEYMKHEKKQPLLF